MTGINITLYILSVIVLLPIAMFALECAAAVLRRKSRATVANRSDVSAKPRVAVLIPAHNEEVVIRQTLESMAPSQSRRVVVVADNCDDRTAELAVDAGAEVLVRNDPAHRGKGFALQHGIEMLRTNDPPDVLVVVDADCLTDRASIDTLARCAWQGQRPIQALNLTDREPARGPVQAVSLLANRFGNQIRPSGLNAMGLPCRLAGTGMAVPWRMLESVQPAGASLVEDLQWGVDLALNGHMATFCPEASVVSSLPPTDRAFVSQRLRWDHGHLRMAAVQIPRLFSAAVRQRSWRLLGAALDLSIPPLTLLVSVWLLATLLAVAAWAYGASAIPLGLLIGGGVALTAALALGWAAFCRQCVPARTFAAIPFYILRKLPIYFQFLFRRQNAWVRTERTAQEDAPDRLNVLGVRIRNTSRTEAIEQLEDRIVHRNGRPTSVFFVNAHTLNLAASKPAYRDVLNGADHVFADGTGVRWAARLQNIHIRENMVGTDFVPALFHATADRGHTYFLLGADRETIPLAADYARRMFPGWRQVGFHHGYLTDAKTLSAAIEQINAARPDVLLVGMGNPLQEQWIDRHRAQLEVGACLGVGGLFDHWAGNLHRAPRWLLRLGHEWIWLLLQQPRQKAARYLVGNPLFLARILRERLQLRQSQRL